jgi:Flp pilus assembly protein TadD
MGAVSCAQDPEVKKQSYLDRGKAHYASGKYNEAIIELKNALQIDPKFTLALYHLGLSYKEKGWLVDAARELQKVATLTPDWLDGRAALGSVYVEMEAWDDALAEAHAIRKAEPDNVQGIYLTSLALKGKKKLAEALDVIGTAVRLNPNLPELYKTRGDILAQLGRTADAEQSYQTALAKNQNYTDVYVGLGELLAARGDRAGAESAFLRAKVLDSASVRPRLALARFYSSERPIDATMRSRSFHRSFNGPLNQRRSASC